jgi:phosphatidylinositol alpha-mannosyltransferase
MRVAFVLDDSLDPPDGVQQYIVTLGKWLADQGHYVAYIVADTERNDIDHVYSLGAFITTRFNGNVVRTPSPVPYNRIRAALAEIQPDIIHVQMPYSPFLAARVIKSAGPATAVVGTFHILPTDIAGAAANHALAIALRGSLRRFDGVVAVSQAAADFARRAYGLRPRVIPNTIDVSRFAVSAKQREHGKIRIVFLGRLVPRKGVMSLIESFNELPDDVADRAELVIGGRGPLTTSAQRLAGANRTIKFAGFVPEDEKAKFLAGADIAVFPSTGGESFGIILLEAMAAGAGTVIAGDNPGYRSVMGGMPDAMVDASNIRSIQLKLIELIKSPSKRNQLALKQRHIAARHDVTVIGPELLSWYADCAAGHTAVHI